METLLIAVLAFLVGLGVGFVGYVRIAVPKMLDAYEKPVRAVIRDAMVTGNGFLRQNDKGDLERVDPFKVKVTLP